MNKRLFFVFKILFCIFSLNLYSEEFLTPLGQQKQVNVTNDKAKYFLIKPGQELSFKVIGPNTIKIYGRIVNPSKSGNASFMVYQGNTLIGAMLVTPKPSQDIADNNKNMPLSAASVQEFNISDGEHTLKVKSSPKSPEAVLSVETMKKQEASLDLIPLVPLAPLVPPKSEEKSQTLELIPLVPLTPSGDTKTAKGEERPKEIIAQNVSAPKPVEAKSQRITTVVEFTEKPSIEKRYLQLGIDVGTIIPLQNIGGPYINTSFQSIYFPIKSNYSFGVGARFGYHNLAVDIKDSGGKKMYEMDASLIPVNLTFLYSLPLSRLILIDWFFGGGISIISAQLKSQRGFPSKSSSSISPLIEGGGAVILRFHKNHSLAIKLGYEGGKTSLDFVKDLDIGGIIITSGYNYTF